DKNEGLSPQEKEICRLVSEGRSNKEIGHQLGLSPKTVGNNLTRIYQKTGTKNRMELRQYLRVQGGSEVQSVWQPPVS
ncbi:MAG: helix-turn-helix transcriptional regulator, partial [Okeania sp. SIO3B3]|nr:helix-turn-helix transcriptional regulator [Okeania sp. SIO3B3]